MQGCAGEAGARNASKGLDGRVELPASAPAKPALGGMSGVLEREE